MIIEQFYYPNNKIDRIIKDLSKIIYFQPVYVDNYISEKPNEFFIRKCIIITETFTYIFRLTPEEDHNIDSLKNFGTHIIDIGMRLTHEKFSNSGWLKFLKNNQHFDSNEQCILTKFIIDFKEYSKHISAIFSIYLTNKQFKWIEFFKFSKKDEKISYYTIHYRLKDSLQEILHLPILENSENSWLKDFPVIFKKPYYNQLKRIENKYLAEIEKVNSLIEAIPEEERLLFEIEENENE